MVKGIALKFYFLLRQILFRVYLCTGKSAPYLLLFDDYVHHFKVVVLFFTFLKLFFLFEMRISFVTSLCLFHDV